MKRLVSCMLIACTITSISVLNVGAAHLEDTGTSVSEKNTEINMTIGDIGVEFTPTDGYIKPADEELRSANTADEVAAISRRRFEADASNYSEEKLIHVQTVLETYNALDNYAVAYESNAAISSKQLLVYFCSEDGMSAGDIYTAGNIGNSATKEAETKYPNQADAGTFRDSYRHFTWNHRMTTKLSKASARIVGCNYEWAAVLQKYVQNAYDDYIKDGMSTSNAESKAYSYAYRMRNDFYSLCANSLKTFSGLFDNASVRDLYNNCYGRAYADKYSYTYSNAFNAAIRNGDLINSDGAVTSANINTVWRNNWYTAKT